MKNLEQKQLELTIIEKALLESMVNLNETSLSYADFGHIRKGYQCDPCDACGPDCCFTGDNRIYS